MNNWPTKKLGEVVEKLELKKAQTNSWPYIEIGDVDIENKSIILKDKKSIKGAIIAPADSVLVSRVRPTRGAIVYLDKDYVVSSAFSVIKPKLFESSSKFLFYWLGFSKDFIRYLQKKQKGSNYPSVRDKDILNFEIPLPPLNIQQKIVERLDAIKKAQELNDKQIELAEELFQSLLHRELDPKGKNWEVKKLGEICDCKDGDWILTKDLQTGNDVRLIQLGDIGEINFLDKTHKYISKKRCQELSCTLLKPNDILLNRMGDPIGIACILPHLSYPAITAVDVTIIRSKKEIANQFFILYSLNSKAIRRQIEAFATGSTRRRISRKNLEKIKIPLPPLETQQKIVEKLSAVQEYKKKLLDQKQKLQELFESVLNKSFKGELI